MSILSICGVPLPVAIDSLQLSLEDVGTKARNTRGHRILERRRSKWSFGFSLSPKPLDEVMLYRSLILGDGESWPMTSSAYGSKGLQVTGTGAWSGSGGGNPISSNGTFRLTTGQTMVVPGRIYDQSAVSAGAAAGITGATLAGWRYDEGTTGYRLFGWSWRGVESGAIPVKREKVGAIGSSGAVQAYSGSETLSANNGTLTVTAPGAGGGWRFSNMLLIPWFLPQAQVDQLLEGLALVMYQLPMLPRVYVTTDMLPTEQQKGSPVGTYQSSLICHGEVSELAVRPVMRGGSFSATDAVLSGTLIEV